MNRRKHIDPATRRIRFVAGREWRRMGILLILCGALALHPLPVNAQNSNVTFDKVKATFIYKFTTFVSWPEGSFEKDDSPLVIAVIGNQNIFDELSETVSDLKAGGRPLQIVHSTIDALDDLDCHIIFIDDSQAEDFFERIEPLKEQSILTIGESKNFAKSGGMIRIFENNNKPRLEVNIRSVKKADLKISSQVLKLSDVIRD